MEAAGVERSELVVRFRFTVLSSSCAFGPGLVIGRIGFGESWTSCFFSATSSFSSFFSPALSDSNRSSLRGSRARGSRVRPLTIKLVSPCEMSSLSSVLMASCLNKKPDIALGLALTGSDSSLGASGTLSDC